MKHEMKVIMQARDLPDGAVVTEVNGTTRYTAAGEISFFVQKGVDEKQARTVTPRDGCVFLVRSNGDVLIYPPTAEFVWLTDSDELVEYLEESGWVTNE